ncbi:tetratricopeptide repeat protein [Variovorax sp. VNK109]|uniref:tetratricopeptide repeat protein n=1 Tax=Variovorax sp. VNK109 TaxID=3400919 RepID=UPI003C108DF8
MKSLHRLAMAVMAACAMSAHAQNMQAQATQSPPAAATSGPPVASAMDAELFYRLLLGEMSVRAGEPDAAFGLILDSARKTGDAALYERAVNIALQARAGESALQAARAWKDADPKSREANRYVLQILLALNRITETVDPLRAELANTPPAERSMALAVVPRYYTRASDRKLAATVVEQALAADLANPVTATSAWTAVGRMRMAAGDTAGAIQAATRGQAADPFAEGPAMLAIEMMDPKTPQAEPIIKRYLDGKPVPELRMGYARALLDGQRYAEATAQLQIVTTEKPDFAEAWLVLGSLQAQDNQQDAAEASLKRYIVLAQDVRGAEEKKRGLAQAYLALSQIAEKRKDYAAAEAWLSRIENAEDLLGARTRRASILAKQGKIDEARELIRTLPGRNAAEIRLRLLAEVQLLRDNKRYQDAYDLLSKAIATSPEDTDLLYDQATLAEKLGSLSEMERILRRVIAIKPEAHHAYNALGYSLADRNVRLDEARELIKKALEFAPNDPFITDSLGWVEFRAGNRAEALRILDTAFKARPDAEIAAHLGEVLWTMGQRDRALSIWREGLLLNSENETLQETLKRLRAKP